MQLVESLAILRRMGPSVIRTSDVMAALRAGKSHASKLLSRLATTGHVLRIKRGLWAFTDGLDPLTLVGHLTAPFPSYVSLQSALYYHGLISQIPGVTYCVSLDRSRVYQTPVGTFSVHHVAPGFFRGYEEVGEQGIQMASPEKALLDFLYLSSAKSALFRALPELEIPARFSLSKARRLIRHIESSPRRALVAKRLDEVVAR
jgi:predicted transcriptional regulator of viral defense system